jgi:plastocyanin
MLRAAASAFALLTSPALADTVTIHISNFTFAPAAISIKPGTTVTWLNDDDTPHSVIEATRRFHSAALDTGDSFTMTFTTPGEVDYFCGFHAMMQGKIIVAP